MYVAALRKEFDDPLLTKTGADCCRSQRPSPLPNMPPRDRLTLSYREPMIYLQLNLCTTLSEVSDHHRKARQLAPGHRCADTRAVTPPQLILVASAGSVDGEIAILWHSLAIPESKQRISQSDTAVPEKSQRVVVVTFTIGTIGSAVAKNLAAGRLAHLTGTPRSGDQSGEWCTTTLAPSIRKPDAAELLRFIITSRCIRVMLRGASAGVILFRPKVPCLPVEPQGVVSNSIPHSISN